MDDVNLHFEYALSIKFWWMDRFIKMLTHLFSLFLLLCSFCNFLVFQNLIYQISSWPTYNKGVSFRINLNVFLPSTILIYWDFSQVCKQHCLKSSALTKHFSICVFFWLIASLEQIDMYWKRKVIEDRKCLKVHWK